MHIVCPTSCIVHSIEKDEGLLLMILPGFLQIEIGESFGFGKAFAFYLAHIQEVH
jgi:hypothetical protein